MIFVRPSSIPQYFQEGELFKSLDLSIDDEIEVPNDALKLNPHITNTFELEHTLTSLRFWGVDNIPYEVVDFLLLEGYEDVIVDQRFIVDFPMLSFICTLRTKSNLKRVEECIKCGSIYLLKFFLESGSEIPSNACVLAVASSQENMLKFLHETHSIVLDKDTCQSAFCTGHMGCLEYMRDVGALDLVRGYHVTIMPHAVSSTEISVPDMQTLLFALAHGCEMTYTLMETASAAGKIDIMQYAREKGCEWSVHTAIHAARHNQLLSLQCYHELGGDWKAEVAYEAAKYGHLECLIYLCTTGCPLDCNTTSIAAYNGKIECLKYLHHMNCPWDEKIPNSACEGNQLECLQYALENNCSININALRLAELYGSQQCFEYLISKGFKPK